MNRRRNPLFALTLGLALAPAMLASLQTPAAAQDTGADIFQKKCMTCHGPNALPNLKGPTLKGVFGRTIASVKDYPYSDGLKAKTGKWTQANLDAFLTSPKDFAPGTKMKISIADPAQRAQVIAILKAQK